MPAQSGEPPRQARSRSNQETVISEAPRRARGRGPAGPSGPQGPQGPRRGGDGDDDKPRWRRFIPSWKIVMASFAVLAAGIFGMIAVAYANTPLPVGVQDQATAEQSTIYYADGKTPIAKIGTPRTIVQANQMADSIKDAAVAIENKTFYTDSGISIPGMVRSLYMTATGQQLQGASTITQQMARNYYQGLDRDVSIKRKVKEIFVAVKLDKNMSKEEILKNYLNTVNFGRAYGIEAAAQTYFGVKAIKLTPVQAAYLAARIQTPSWSDDATALQDRFKTVITNMAELWPQKYGQLPATAKFPKVEKSGATNAYSGLKGYMITQVLQELKVRRNLSPDEVRKGGFKIVSTFDENLMKAAKTAVESTMAGMPKEFHAGLAAVNPKNGRIVAFYGGSNYLKDPWNEPFDSAKQAASAFKPYVLAAWLQAGYSLKSYVPGNHTVPKELPGQAAGGFRNSHNVGASIDVIKATAQSVNTAYVSMAFDLPGKLDDVKKIVENAGFDQSRMDTDVEKHSYQFAIGSAPVTAVEQAAGYSIFANAGRYTMYHVVKEVRRDKQLVYPEQLASKAVISPEAAADATTAMQEVLRTGTAHGKGLGNRPSAGKTGTNNEEKDAWFVGYTPQLSVAVGMYKEECRTAKGKLVAPKYSNCPTTPTGKASKKYNVDHPYTRPKEVSLGFEGADRPTSAWRAFMMAALANKPVEQFPDKADLGEPKNIVPSPEPKPTPSDPFEDPSQDPNANCGLVTPCDGNNDNVTDPNNNGFPTDQGDQGGFGGGADQPSIPNPMASRREDQ
ncbi:transglycosylase domain-containing protein [Nonomuraea sp. NPDC050536]|uniref:transglycosylase domain-containing protein n=1 Tax=Nonomuraea sp. NPDC050536 TaxID=3364366 RepID=UPI0037C77B90